MFQVYLLARSLIEVEIGVTRRCSLHSHSFTLIFRERRRHKLLIVCWREVCQRLARLARLTHQKCCRIFSNRKGIIGIDRRSLCQQRLHLDYRPDNLTRVGKVDIAHIGLGTLCEVLHLRHCMHIEHTEHCRLAIAPHSTRIWRIKAIVTPECSLSGATHNRPICSQTIDRKGYICTLRNCSPNWRQCLLRRLSLKVPACAIICRYRIEIVLCPIYTLKIK